MTFEEWWDNREYPYTDKDCAKAAWDVAYEQGAEDSLSVAYMTGLKDASTRKLPEGYVLVPVEPTEKMLKAAYEIDMEVKYDNRGIYLHSETTSVRRYKAMLKAAQEEE